MVIFDTPPFGIVSDIAPLLSMSDLVMVIAKFRETKQKVLQHTVEDLSSSNENIGIVLNGYKASKSYDSYDTKGLHKYMYKEYYEYETENDKTELVSANE